MLGLLEVFHVEYQLIAVTTFANGAVDEDVVDTGALTVVADNEQDACEWVEDVIMCETSDEVTDEYTTTYRVECTVYGSFPVYDQKEADHYHLRRV